ncbi:TetR/AcrR family transcriptional regulator [Streptomyces sp. MK5]|uniref:TetR/AcrR family transcriptional regulator n=1 Tax=Streptomyces sp. MK5 TaxID=3064253 RepID=UPI002740B75B|nr:TetR/AcrR family transcriptional regulator [Streptomyces sp. MK5]
MPTTAPPSPRRRLLDTAARLFYAHGIHTVGIDRLIAESGIAKASFYKHFPSKDDLVAAYLDERNEQWQARLAAELPRRADDPVEQVLCVFDLLAEDFSDPTYRGCPFINAAAEYPSVPAVLQAVARRRRARADLFARLLGQAGLKDPSDLAAQLCLIYDGAMVAAQLDDPEGPQAHGRRARTAAAALIAARRS